MKIPVLMIFYIFVVLMCFEIKCKKNLGATEPSPTSHQPKQQHFVDRLEEFKYFCPFPSLNTKKALENWSKRLELLFVNLFLRALVSRGSHLGAKLKSEDAALT